MNTATQTGWHFLDSATPAATAGRSWHGQSHAHQTVASLLDQLGTRRPERSIAEALWDCDDDDRSAATISVALERLGLLTSVQQSALRDLDTSRFPCLFLADRAEDWCVLTSSDGRDVDALDIKTGESRTMPVTRIKGTVLLATPNSNETDIPPSGWIESLLGHARSTIGSIAGVSLIINLLAVATPIFVMTVYDRVIGASSELTLMHLLPGIAIALILDFVLRVLRSDLASKTGAWLASESSNELFTHLLSLPAAMTERSTVTTQLMRLKSFDSIRSVISGKTVTSLIDAPFVVIFLIAIAMIAGPLAIVPLLSLLLFIGAGILLSRRINVGESTSSRYTQKRQELVTETLQKLPTIRQSGAADRWRTRFDAISEQSAMASATNVRLRGWLQSLGQAMTMGTGLVTLLIGIELVLQNSMSAGALIATVMLTWRIFGPVQAVFAASPQIRQARRSADQVKAFANIPAETDASIIPAELPVLSGAITFDRVTFRYGAGEPELAGVSFAVEPGETMAIAGRNGAGKSTVLKMLLGLYHPLAGKVLFDGRNLRQLDVAGLRRQISYNPQLPRLIPGSIRDNLLMAEPSASTEDMWTALTLAGAAETVTLLDRTLETVYDPRNPGVFSQSLIARICLARTWLRPAPLVLLDEPAVSLDFESEFALIESLDSLRGRSTVLLVTHRPEHVAICDKALLLENGAVQFFGSGPECAGHMETQA